MTPSELQGLVARHAAAGLVAPPPLTRTGGKAADGSHALLGVIADVVVDLADALDHAERSGLDALDIYADTLRAPPAFDRRLNGSLQRLSIATRRIVTTDGAALRMLHDGERSRRQVRLFSHRIEGTFALFGGPDGSVAYDLASLATDFDPPRFRNFGWRENAAQIGATVVPRGLLLHGEPLHRVLAATFSLTAAILGDPRPSERELALCHEALTWIIRWSGVETGFGELIRSAEALRALLPVPQDRMLAHPIPSLAAERYVTLAEAQHALMSALEDTTRSLAAGGDVSHLAGMVVTAFGDRDTVDLRTLELRCRELEKQLEAQVEALDRASRTMREEQFAAELASLELTLQKNLAAIKGIAKLSLQIAFSLIVLAGSIAALCVGVPPNPQALTEQGRKGVRGLNDLYQQAGQLVSNVQVKGPLDALAALVLSFMIPVDWLKNNADTLKQFADPAKSILALALPVWHGPLHGLDVAALAEQLGSNMRILAAMPDAAEAKAAWSALEVDIVNRLDLVLADKEAEAEVKKAAAEFKSKVQRVAIYGRLLAEQAAAKGAIARELGAVKLEALGMIAKRQRLEALNQEIANQAGTRERLRAETALRAEGAARAFFVAAFGARAAQRYETGRTALATLTIPASTPQMADALAGMKTEYAAASAASRRNRVRFEREIRISDPEMLAGLSAGSPVHVAITLDQEGLKRFNRVRLREVQAWLETAEPITTRVAITLTTGSAFLDRGDGGAEHVIGSPQALHFEYRGTQVEVDQALDEVALPPFTTWLAEVLEPASLPGPVQALRLVMRGTASVR